MQVEPIRRTGRGTQGVKLMALDDGSTIVAVAHNGEAEAEQAVDELEGGTDVDGVPTDAPDGPEGDDDVAEGTIEADAPQADGEDEQ